MEWSKVINGLRFVDRVSLACKAIKLYKRIGMRSEMVSPS